MVQRKGQQKGPQQHAEGQHGEKTHERFIERIHDAMDPDEERQRAYVQHGWNVTGDSYRRDADGYFWYQARTDDMIISGGYNIAGPEVESVLLEHPAVRECGVVGVPDEERGQAVKAFVVLAAGVERCDATVRLLQDFVKAQLAPYKYPRRVEFVDALPRTETGKLQRFRLRAGQ